MKICDFTKPELDKFRELCNFTPQESIYFELRSKDKSNVQIAMEIIKDQLCADKIDAKNDEIANLRQQIAMKDLSASQTAQNSLISQGFANEVDQLYNRLNNCPVPTTPVYGRTPIFSCNNGGCGCGNNTFFN